MTRLSNVRTPPASPRLVFTWDLEAPMKETYRADYRSLNPGAFHVLYSETQQHGLLSMDGYASEKFRCDGGFCVLKEQSMCLCVCRQNRRGDFCLVNLTIRCTRRGRCGQVTRYQRMVGSHDFFRRPRQRADGQS